MRSAPLPCPEGSASARGCRPVHCQFPSVALPFVLALRGGKARAAVPWGVTGLNPELLVRKIKHAGDFSQEKFKLQLDYEPCRSSPRWLCS